MLAATTTAGLAGLEVDTGVASLVPASDQVVADWAAAGRSFGADPVLVLLEREGGAADLLGRETLPALVGLEGRLAGLDDVAVVYGPGTVANQIAGQVQDLLLTVTARRDAIRVGAEEEARAAGASDDAATQAGRQAVAGFEARYGGLIAAGLPVGLPTLQNPMFARRIFFDDAGQARPEFRWIVPDDRRVALYVRPREGLDQDGTEALVRAVRAEVGTAKVPAEATITGAPVVAAALGAEIRRELPRLAVAALVAAFAAFAFSHRTRTGGRGLSRFAPFAVALAATAVTLGVFGLLGVEVSLGMAAFLPIMVGVGSDLPIQSSHPVRFRILAGVAAASAAGFAALTFSPLPFVRSLGWALALGILLSCALGIVALRPARPTDPTGADPTGPSPSRDTATAPAPRAGEPGPPPTRDGPGERAPTGSGGGGAGGRRGLVAAGVALAAVGFALLPSIPLESRPDRLAAGLPAIAEARAAEAVLGASGEVSVWARGDDVLTPERLDWFRAAEAALVTAFGDRLRPVVSPGRLLRFLGDDPTAGEITAALTVLPGYLSGATIRSDRREAVISFGLRLDDLSRQAKLLRDVERRLPPAPAGLDVDVTGLPVVAARAHDLLSGDRVLSNLSGLVLVTAVLAVALPRRREAAVAGLAAALAFGWGLVALRVFGVALSPLTVTLGSLTAAVGAEFTVFARERTRTGVARPWAGVIAAAATSVAGFAALAVSRLELLREFGLVLAGSVLLSLLAARLLTPAREAVTR